MTKLNTMFSSQKSWGRRRCCSQQFVNLRFKFLVRGLNFKGKLLSGRHELLVFNMRNLDQSVKVPCQQQNVIRTWKLKVSQEVGLKGNCRTPFR